MDGKSKFNHGLTIDEHDSTHKITIKPIEGYFVITPDDLHWRPSNIMKIPNADFLERAGSENLG